jgi:hypothetical protein
VKRENIRDKKARGESVEKTAEKRAEKKWKIMKKSKALSGEK